ncbi:putative MFS family arabinose efflux permease [Arthrobacter globiformis]|uniref:MFS transporter n=1 Tax=Arthrobacter globiformis TaxID=1665 RepID=UPI00277F352B|nr:MFS transporter [Arthrobacter globiformis]MDQ1059719.1 putative MFS family arabinose efflux permease [Arthrobacter globiformis]
MTTPEDTGVFVQISRPEGLEDDTSTRTPEQGAKTPEEGPKKRRRLHPAWAVAAVAFLALVGAAGFRAAPGVLMVPLQQEFGWSTTVLSSAVSINLVLFGLTAPFAAALMERFGIRAVTAVALGLIGAGSALTVLVNQSWQILLTWGLLIGLGTGSMALVFAATIANTWFTKSRGLVIGILTAGSAAGQLVFLPFIAMLAQDPGWRQASLLIAAGALAVVPLVLKFLKNSPADVGALPYGAEEPSGAGEGTTAVAPAGAANGTGGGNTDRGNAADEAAAEPRRNAAVRALQVFRRASRNRTFWALAAGFAICGATTNGLIGTHFIPSAHDHGMPETTAAGLLAVVGIFDILGTIASGWLTDRFNPRILLAVYYQFRGIGLLVLPLLLGSSVQPSMIVFVVIYGLDWVATVPPTAAICRQVFGADGSVVFGWVFAAHQLGAAAAALAAGAIRDATGHYTYAWLGAAAMCTIAAVISATIRKDAGRRKPVAVAVASVD